MARIMCTDCGTRVAGTGPISVEDRQYAKDQKLCGPCADEGQMDIAHNNGHEDIPTDQCWYCHPELDTRNNVVTPGHTNTVAKSRTSHAGCGHPLTPQARAACRKARVENPNNAPDGAVPTCTCGGNEDTDGPVLIHSHKCLLKGTDGKTEKIKRAEANMRRANAKVTVVSELPMPKLTPAQLDSPVFQSMMRKRVSK